MQENIAQHAGFIFTTVGRAAGSAFENVFRAYIEIKHLVFMCDVDVGFQSLSLPLCQIHL